MNQRKKEEFIEKVKIRASKSLKIKEVCIKNFPENKKLDILYSDLVE